VAGAAFVLAIPVARTTAVAANRSWLGDRARTDRAVATNLP
jgi:hypothetical protein